MRVIVSYERRLDVRAKVCGTRGKLGYGCKALVGKPERGDRSGHADINGRMLLKWSIME
jgi:hypothetical protein